MHVVGTAGHVDHGKSTLVLALTGIDPDRLKEEKEREMTIDLGFAWLTLPGGETVGIVDVPGHKDFIKNMLAGVGGIDAALFVVAADEGVMPQTREHLAILDLLGIDTGVVAITKIDLAEDEDWLELVMAEVAAELEDTSLEHAPMVPVSARTGAGLPALVEALARVLAEARPRRDVGRPRLSIDRVFTVPGFGTVVTGTLLDGSLHVGQEVEILPRRLQARVRGLQTYKEKIDTAVPSSRVAVNLSGVAVTDIARGDVLTSPGWLEPTTLIDVRLDYIDYAPRELKHNTPVDFFSGAAQVPAAVRLLDHEVLRPGETGWVQLRLAKPVALRKGDRFIVRLPSPSITVGGGVIVNEHPRRRYRRFRPDVVAQLETQAHGAPQDILLQSLEERQPCELRELVKRSGLAENTALESLHTLLDQGQVLLLTQRAGSGVNLTGQSNVLLVSQAGWGNLSGRIRAVLESFHRQYPLRKGMPREELKSRLRLEGRVFNELVQHALRTGLLQEHDALISLTGHQVTFDAATQRRIADLLDVFRKQPYATPSVAESEKIVGPEVLAALLEQEVLVRVNNDVLFMKTTYDEMVRRVVEKIQAEGSITVAQVRDMFQASRKYALGLMEHLDEKKITRRQGDVRVLR